MNIFFSIYSIKSLIFLNFFSLVTNAVLDQDSETLADVSEHILFLETKISPWDKVVSSWKKTFKERAEILKEASSTFAYLEKFPCLAEEKYAELVYKKKFKKINILT